jgi:hypothetical protein
MTDARVVFLGPSLASVEAARRLDARYLPPIRRGDLPGVVAEGVREIGIVDGEFGQSLAVSVMEIRAALSAGARIFGAASMGALRAVECRSLGMIGVGWIFDRYADGSLTSDDEVALVFNPQDLRAITMPLVTIRWSLQLAVEEGVLAPSAAPALLDAARNIGFKMRDADELLHAVAESACKEDMRSLLAFMHRHPLRTDRKRLDALLLLEAMNQGAGGHAEPACETCVAVACR